MHSINQPTSLNTPVKTIPLWILTLTCAAAVAATESPTFRTDDLRPATDEEFISFFNSVLTDSPGSFETYGLVTIHKNRSARSLFRSRAIDYEGISNAILAALDEDSDSVNRTPENSSTAKPLINASLEKTLVTKNAWKIEEHIFRYGTNYLGHAEATCKEVSSMRFQPAWTKVVELRDNSRRFHQTNWKTKSSHYDTRDNTGPRRPLHGEAFSANAAIKLIASSLATESRPRRINPKIAKSCVTGTGPIRLLISKEPILLQGMPVDKLELRIKSGNKFHRFARLAVTHQAALQVLQSVVYNPISGKIVRIDQSDIGTDRLTPKRQETLEELHDGSWIHSAVTFFTFNWNPKIKGQPFEFTPPNSFAIENHSTGTTVIERYPMVGNRRLGPEHVDWGEHSTGQPGEKANSGIRFFFLTLVFAPLLLILFSRVGANMGQIKKANTETQ